jgi:DnaK suppressor protein
MNQKELEYFKNRLLQEKKEIEDDLKQFNTELDFGEDLSPHLEEEADEIEEETYYEGTKKSQEKRLKQIAKALRKINNGRYGICENCGGKIEKEVLEIDPESELCHKCKLKNKK